MPPHRITYDDVADAAYILVTDRLVASTHEIADGTLIDRDAANGAVGIEVLSVTRRLGTRDRDSYLGGLAEGLLLPVRQDAVA